MSCKKILSLLRMPDKNIKQRSIGMSMQTMHITLYRTIIEIYLFKNISFESFIDQGKCISYQYLRMIKTSQYISIGKFGKTLEIVSGNP